MRARFGAAVSLALVAGCAHSVDRRWASAEFTETPSFHAALADPGFRDRSVAAGRYASVSVYSYPTPPNGPQAATLRDLSDHGQQAYIETLSRLGNQGDALRTTLAKPIAGSAAAFAEPVRDESRFERTLVVVVAKKPDARPGERLMRTIVEVVPEGGFQFAGYKVAATDTRTLNVAHVEQSTTASLQANLSAKPPIPAGISAGLTGGVVNGRTSSADIAPSFESLSVDITPSTLRITRESERNLDLTGNTIVVLSLVAAPTAAVRSEGERFQLGSGASLFRGNAPLPPSRATLRLARLQTVARCPVRAKVRMIYQVRDIAAGESHYDEGAQSVRIISDATQIAEPVLVPAEELTVPLYGIISDGRRIEAGDGAARLPLVFTDYDSARDMARWMSATHARSVGSAQLLLGGDPMPAAYPATLTAMRIDRPAAPGQCTVSKPAAD